jgi:hypothetical protein
VASFGIKVVFAFLVLAGAHDGVAVHIVSSLVAGFMVGILWFTSGGHSSRESVA